jgi:hypothetical protein
MFDSVGEVEDVAPVIAYAAAGGPTHRGKSGGSGKSGEGAVAVEHTATATSRGAAYVISIYMLIDQIKLNRLKVIGNQVL